MCHALLDCHKLQVMWQTHPHYSLVCAAPRNSFVAFQWLKSHNANEDLTSIRSAICQAWFRRNKTYGSDGQHKLQCATNSCIFQQDVVGLPSLLTKARHL